jgi:hypothetical protein
LKIAVIGSRNVSFDISEYIPAEATSIISGGASGVDRLAELYADKMNIPKHIIKPDYEKYGKLAPLVRNEAIVNSADMVVAIWDGKSRGTKYVIEYARKVDKPLRVHIV